MAENMPRPRPCLVGNSTPEAAQVQVDKLIEKSRGDQLDYIMRFVSRVLRRLDAAH